MKTSSRKSKKNLLALCLSVLMLTSGSAAFAACSNESNNSDSSSSSSSSSSTTVNDTSLIKNGGFETFDKKDGLNAIGTSVTGWTRSVNSTTSGSALSSKAASGIIDTSADAWKMLTGSNKANAAEMTEAEAAAAWKDLTVKDKLAYLEAWEEANDDDDKDIEDELDFYQNFNIDSGDIPTCENPGTHLKEGEEGYGEDNNVLMLHNQYPETDSTATYKSLGTAQKYTSSSTVTIPAGAAATFSVWVKTSELMCSDTAGNPQKAVGKGAYINVTQSVGSKSLPVFSVKNINTEDMAASDLSNGWMQYSFYLKASSYTDTTFSVVLGLGQGGGEDRGEYVNGYAFFDDLKCEIVTQDVYDDAVTAGVDNPNGEAAGFESLAADKTINVAENMTAKKFAMDFYGAFTDSTILDSAIDVTATTGKIGDKEYTSEAGDKTLPALGEGLDGSKDVKETFKGTAKMLEKATADNNDYLSAIYNNYFAEDDFAKDNDIFVMLSAKGVAYTAKSTYEFKMVDAQNEAVDYLAISFFVKTSDMNGFTGAGITLHDGKNETAFTSIDTTDIAAVTIGEDEDYYDGWQQCFFFVENDFEEKADAKFTLSFNFGPTTITGTTLDSYYAGFAAFTGFKTYTMSKAEYDSVSSGTYKKVVTVTGTLAEEATGNDGFDSAANVPTDALKEGLANPLNYTGVYSDSYYVNQANGTSKEVNTNKNAGLLNRDYFLGTEDVESYYVNDETAPTWMTGLTSAANKSTAKDVWNTMFGYNGNIGSATQPLLIWNDGENENAYGFIGSSTTIAANSYAKISVAVKVGALAGVSGVPAAYIYLVDMDDTTYSNTLSIGRKLTYWYDDDGNICTGEPDEKGTEVAFNLKSNGLYQANEKWSGYASLTAEQKKAYFANLNAYEKDSDGNLVVAENGASHAYTDHWNNEGLDGIAFYAKDGKYYANRAKTLEVLNLADITSTTDGDNKPLTARYTQESNKKLMAKVENTNGAWVNVSFYIHTGDQAKNYRLEVWSGERNGKANPVSSYVIFDMNYTEDAESNFATLIEEYKDDKGAVSFESVFSYFDSAEYLRYDASLDKNDLGNLYEKSYVPSEQTEGVAYLYCADGEDIRYFADYSYSEKTVTPQEKHDHTHDDSSSTDSTATSETNPLLLASSIAIAAVLILAVVSIVVREIMKKHRKSSPKAKKNNKK